MTVCKKGVMRLENDTVIKKMLGAIPRSEPTAKETEEAMSEKFAYMDEDPESESDENKHFQK